MNMKKQVVVAMLMVFGLFSLASAQQVNLQKSLTNAEEAWKSAFPGGSAILGVISVVSRYTMLSYNADIKKTDSLVSPMILEVDIACTVWSKMLKKGQTIESLLTEVKSNSEGFFFSFDKTMRFKYKLSDGVWILDKGNESANNFIMLSHQSYNKHIPVDKLMNIPAK